MQPNTTMYVPNDKEMAVRYCYLQIDCGFFFIWQDANSTNSLHWFCTLNSILWLGVFVFVLALENFWGEKHYMWIIILSFNRNEKLLSSVLYITSILFFFWKIIWACHLLPQHNWTHNYYVNLDFHMLPEEHRPFGTGDFKTAITWNTVHLT